MQRDNNVIGTVGKRKTENSCESTNASMNGIMMVIVHNLIRKRNKSSTSKTKKNIMKTPIERSGRERKSCEEESNDEDNDGPK